MNPNEFLSRLTPNAFVFDLNGVERRQCGFRIMNAGFIAVSADEKMIAFWGQGGPAPATSGLVQPNKGLLFARLDSTVFQRIESFPAVDPDPNGDKRPETLAWSPDSSEIAYGKGDTIYVYNLRHAASRALAKGSNPLWSPDGAWISYRGPNGEATLVDPLGKRSQHLMPRQRINHALHWSPDGRYLLLTLLREHGSLLWANLAIYRLSDGALTSFGEPGLSSLDDSGKEWGIRPRH